MQFQQDLTEVVNHYLGGSEGDNAEYLCPFHADTKPSLVILPATDQYPKQKYHCRSCGAHGDVADFVMKMEECSFKTAQVKLMEMSRDEEPAPTSQGRHLFATFEDEKPLPLTKFLLPEEPMRGLTRDGHEIAMHGTCHPGQRVALRMLAVPSRQRDATWVYLHDVQNNTKRWRIWKQQYQRNCMLAQLRVMNGSGTTYAHELAAVVEHI